MANTKVMTLSVPKISTDIYETLQRGRLIYLLSVGEIKRRFKRTVLGPFWVTLNLGIFIFAMGWLFSNLWGTEISSFLPFFSSGFIVWMLISTLITESCQTFTTYESFFKQIPLPYMLFPVATVLRNIIVFMHHIVIFLIIVIAFKVPVTYSTLLVIPALILLSLLGAFLSFILGSLCARYRDIQQIIQSILQLAVFVTPIFWPPEQLGHKKIIFVNVNPLYHCINIVRKPMMGETPEALSWMVVLGLMLTLALAASFLYKKKSRDIVFWL